MSDFPKKGHTVIDKYGKIICMAYADRYLMVRRPSSIPFILTIFQWWQLQEEAQAAKTEE